MVHEYSHTTPAVKGILSFATFSERKHMLKTLKRKIALVAVAAIGASGLALVAAPSASAAVTAVTAFDVDAVGITSATDVAANATEVEVFTRVGATITVKAIVQGGTPAAGAKWRVVLDTADAGTISTIATGVGTATAVATVTGTFTVTADMNGKNLRIQGDDAADGTYEVVSAVGVLLNVINAGAPASIAWAKPATTHLSAGAADHNFSISPKDAAGVTTILLDTEAIGVDISPVTGVLSSQVGLFVTGATANGATSATIGQASSMTAGVYSVTLNGDGSIASGTPASGTTLPNTSYSMFAQLLTGTAAVGAPVTATYKRLSNTASLAGTVSFVDGTTTTTAVTSRSSASGIATTSFKVKAVDTAGAVIEGATVVLSAGTVTGAFTNNSQTTGTDGLTATAMTFTPDVSGTGTIIATITTGTGTITSSIPVTVAGYGATVAAVAKTTAVNVDGTGFKAGTAPAYAGSLNITKIKVTITGLDANKAVLLAAVMGAGTATSDVGTSPIADATGTVVSTWTLAGVGASTFSVTADADGAGGGTAVITVVTVTFATANTGSIVTVPATATTSFAAPSATSNIVATVTNQFGAIVTGGVVVFTNSIKPAAATAQTAATVSVSATGTATFAVVLGSAVGTYTYTAEAKDVNGTLTTGTNTSTVTYVVTASGAPKTLTVTGGANTATTNFRVLIDGDGSVNTAAATAVATLNTVTTNLIADTGALTTMTVSVTDDAGAGVSGVIVTATPDAGVLINSAAATVLYSAFNEAGDLAVATVNGVATFFVTASKPGTLNVKFAAGSATATGSFNAVTNGSLDVPATIPTGRTITLDKATTDVSGNVVQITATVKDVYGNPVKGVNVSGAITGTAGRFTGGGRTQAGVASDAAGLVIFEVTSNGVEAGTGTLTVSAAEAANAVVAGNEAKLISDDLTANSATVFTAASTKSATSVLTVKAASTSAASTEIAGVKTDVATANAAVKALATQVTVLQASVATLIDSLTTQIATLLKSVSALTKAVAKLQAASKKK